MTTTKRLYSILLLLLLIGLPLSAVSRANSLQQNSREFCSYFRETSADEGFFSVCDDASAEFRRAFVQWGVQRVGYPISERYNHDGFVTQAFQKAIMQWRPESESVALVNVFDDLHQAGFDDLLLEQYQTPRQFPAGWDGDGSFDEVINKRQALLNERAALREAYFSVDEPLTFYGLPTSEVEDMGNHFAIRLQRAVLQEWKEEVPWAAAGEVTIANGADIAKALGALPAAALQPVPLPTPTPPQPSPTATVSPTPSASPSPSPSSSSAFPIADVSVMAWAPDSGKLAVAGEQGVRLLSMAGTSPDQSDQSPLLDSAASVKTLLFSPDSKLLAAGLEDGSVLLWTLTNTNNSPAVLLTAHTKPVLSLAFSPDSRLLASGGGVFDPNVPGNASPVMPFKDREVRLWETSSGKLLNALVHQRGSISDLAFTADGSAVIAATNDQVSGRNQWSASLLAWDVTSGELKYDRTVSKPVIFGHHRQLAASTKQYGSTIKVWELPTLAEVNASPTRKETPTGYVHEMKFNQNDTILAALVGTFDFGAERVKFWDVATRNELAVLPITDPFALHPTEPVAVFSAKGEATVWDIRQGTQIGTGASERQANVISLSFSPDGKNLLLLFEDNTLELHQTLSTWGIPAN